MPLAERALQALCCTKLLYNFALQTFSGMGMGMNFTAKFPDCPDPNLEKLYEDCSATRRQGAAARTRSSDALEFRPRWSGSCLNNKKRNKEITKNLEKENIRTRALYTWERE